MISKDFFLALEQLEKEDYVDKDVFLRHLTAGLASGYKKEFGDSKLIDVIINPAKNEIKVFAYRNIVEEVEDPDKEITLADAKKIKSGCKIGGKLSEEIKIKELSRVATQTAMQVVRQRMAEERRSKVMEEMESKEGEIMNAVVRKIEGDVVYFEILGTQLEGIMLAKDRINGERYDINRSFKVYIKKVKNTPKGAMVMVSRSSELFVRRLFELEVPEIAQGMVSIKNIVREAGIRTKIAVCSEIPKFDALGACIGQKGSRINGIVAELNGEKIDIIEWDENIGEFISRALSPAPVTQYSINEDNSARVLVPDDKLSLAIGKDGINARLAARLTGWKIDVKPVSITHQQVVYDEETPSEASTDDSEE